MTEGTVVSLGQNAVMTGMLVCAPMLAAGLLVGLITSVFLAATQIQEFTLTFVPKLAAMALVGVLCAPWMLRTLITFAAAIFKQMVTAR